MWWMVAVVALGADPSWSDLTSSDGWKDVTTKSTDVGDVTVRSKRLDALGCVEGRATVAPSVSALLGVTRDMVRAREWSSSDIALSEELARDGDDFVLFQYYDVPGWTLSSDRFWIVKGQPRALPGGAGTYRYERVDAAAYPDALARARAVSSSVIEPPTNFGEWTFTPAATGTDVTYRSCADFGGAVPDGIQRFLNTQQVPAMVADLVREATRRARL